MCVCRRTKGNKDSFNFLESLNTQSLSICYLPPTTSQLLSVHVLVLAACLKEQETGEAAPTACESARLFPVFAADCASLNDASLFPEITVVQSTKERSSTDVRNGSFVSGINLPRATWGMRARFTWRAGKEICTEEQPSSMCANVSFKGKTENTN